MLGGAGLLYLLGQGWLVVGPLLHGGLTARRGGTRLIQEIPLALLGGLVFNYLLLLVFLSLGPAMAVGGAVSLLGLGFFTAHLYRHRRLRRLTWSAAAPLVGASSVLLLFLGPLLGEPLSAWDARSVWFFHAKMIYMAGSIGPSAGWLDPYAAFSHVDYPKLVASLAAQIVTVMGFWNEYLPKAALVFMLLPAVLWIFSFARRSLSFVSLVLLLLLGLSSDLGQYGLFTWMWNGYMDSLLALLFAVAMLLLGRYAQSAQVIDMLSAVFILLTLPSIKNEGALAALAGLAVAAWLLSRRHDFRVAGLASQGNLKYLLAGLAALSPALLWSLHSHQWGLPIDIAIGSMHALSRLVSRLTDGSLGIILQGWWAFGQDGLLLAGLLLCAYVAWGRSLPRESLPALVTSAMYGLAVVLIYLLTRYSVEWHLETSIHRVMLSTNACMFVLSYFLLNELEGASDPGWQRDAGTSQAA
jgi:hypothetical protein